MPTPAKLRTDHFEQRHENRNVKGCPVCADRKREDKPSSFDESYKKALAAAQVTSLDSRRSPAPRSTIPSESEYERNELTHAVKKEQQVEKAPLADRQEARQKFFEAMRDTPDLVAERIDWILDGTHGHGEMLRAHQIINSPRMNQPAALTHLAGIYEWSCPVSFGVDGWKKLTPAQKARLDKEVKKVIVAFKKSQAETE